MAEVNSYEYEQVHDQAMLSIIHVAALVQVTAFDSAKMTVDVQPMAKSLEGNSYESQPPILGLPVAATRSGGFVFRPWINVGDVGLAVYPDHDIDSAVAGGKESVPLTQRNHSPSDGVYVGGIISGSFAAPEEAPEGSLVIIREDGGLFFAVSPEEIMIRNDGYEIDVFNEVMTVKGNVSIEGDVKVKGNVEIEGNVLIKGDEGVTGNRSTGGDSTVNGNTTTAQNATVGGNSTVNGNINANGNVTAVGDVIALSEKSLGSHTHTAPDGETSPPN